MNPQEIEVLADLTSEKVYQRIMAQPAMLDELAELIATKVNNKLEASGQLEINGTDLAAMANLVSELQNKMEPDVIVTKLDL